METTNLIFYTNVSDKTWKRKYNYTIEVKFIDRGIFRLLITTGKIKDWSVIESSIEDVKNDIYRMVEEGYSQQRMSGLFHRF